MDRLARSIRDGINLLCEWLDAGVRIIIVTMQIDLSGALGQTVAALLLGLAQMEREAIRERQAAGIEAARLSNGGQCPWGGSTVGRLSGKVREKADLIRHLHDCNVPIRKIARELTVHHTTVYRILGQS